MVWSLCLGGQGLQILRTLCFPPKGATVISPKATVVLVHNILDISCDPLVLWYLIHCLLSLSHCMVISADFHFPLEVVYKKLFLLLAWNKIHHMQYSSASAFIFSFFFFFFDW